MNSLLELKQGKIDNFDNKPQSIACKMHTLHIYLFNTLCLFVFCETCLFCLRFFFVTSRTPKKKITRKQNKKETKKRKTNINNTQTFHIFTVDVHARFRPINHCLCVRVCVYVYVYACHVTVLFLRWEKLKQKKMRKRWKKKDKNKWVKK